MEKITINNQIINIELSSKNDDYISLTDMAKFKDKDRTNYIIQNWMRNRYTIEFMGIWEKVYNPNFKGIEFDAFKNQAGSNSFSLTPQRWINTVSAIGIINKSGRYGGTFAHKDIAFEFATWLSPEFKLYLIKEFQRLKNEENKNKNLEWNVKRMLTKINYKIHTNSIKQNIIIPNKISNKDSNTVYANEADILNMALFSTTAKNWKDKNTEKEGNMRDYVNVTQLVCLSNLEVLNSEFIKEGLSQRDRLIKLNEIAISQMKLLMHDSNFKRIEFDTVKKLE
jgi:hypothetical protein